MATRLSMMQMHVLDELKRAGTDGLRRSSTNPTLNALEKKGLAKLEFVESRYVPGHSVEKWTLVETPI